MFRMQSVSRLIGLLFIAASSSASVTPTELDKRTGCSSDNCLRALKAQPSSASAFCSTYTTTTATATTGIPSYIPTTCPPSRVSSACSCLVTPTPTACPTGQVITYPNFYGCPPNPDGGYDCGPQLAPWTITHLASSKPCSLGNGYVWSYDGDPSSIVCYGAPEGGMLDRLSQSLTLCPGLNYTLTAHVGVTDDTHTNYPSFKIYLDSQVLVHKQPPCGNGLYHCDPSWDGSYYREVTAVVTGPASGKGTLIIEISAPGKTDGGLTLFDTITLYSQ